MSRRRGCASAGVRSYGAAMLLCLSTTPAVAAPEPPTVPRSGDLILPLAQVQAIVGEPTLEVDRYAARTSPWVDHSMDEKLTLPCRHFINQDEVFGNNWSNFASAGYSGPSNLGVRQGIAVYPDRDTARQAFDALKTSARQCRMSYPTDVFGPGYTLTEPDPATLLVRYPETVNGPGSVRILALRARVLVEVGAPHLSTDPRVAQTVLSLITVKVPI